jgi:DNA topoisomerase-1
MEKYTLIITEKPDAAQRIASALDKEGKPRKMEENGVPYYVAQRDKKIVIVPAVGHLYTVAAETRERNLYPIFDFKWVPRNMAERGAKQIRTWIETMTKLAENADAFIDACDYDIEGSLIGYCILKYACNNKEQTSKRMKYSTLTKPELEKSYSQPLPHLDFPLIEAGRTRHEVDWLYGINLSRALTNAAKTFSGKYTTLSTGRVQGPTLKFIAAREKSIRTFVPTPYWEVKAKVSINGTVFEAEYEKKAIGARKEAETILTACKGRNGQAEKIEIKEFRQPPPLPFDLGGLQNEAYGLFRYAPIRTASIAQRLYLDALISYPRTSSQKLPLVINYETILKNLSKSSRYTKLAAELLTKPELKPEEGKKEDPAHPAIYPTGNIPERVLGVSERDILDLVIRRFMAVFGEPATRQSIKITVNVNGHHFYLMGKQIMRQGWLRFYEPYARMQEVLLPDICEGQTVSIKEILLEDKFTKAPSRYNPSSLLKSMEKHEIGTKATRADIIQTLYDRKYVQDERMAVTDLGFEVLEVLENYCPTIISIMMTKELEEKMNKIQEQKERRENVLANAVEMLRPAAEKLRENEKMIGGQLSNAIRESELQERIIGTCPICKTGKLMTLYSRKTGKRFIGCSNYFKGLCKTSFPLPQKGYIKPLKKNCPSCSWPEVQVRMRGGRPWTVCFNPKCPLKENRRQRIEMQNMQ